MRDHMSPATAQHYAFTPFNFSIRKGAMIPCNVINGTNTFRCSRPIQALFLVLNSYDTLFFTSYYHRLKILNLPYFSSFTAFLGKLSPVYHKFVCSPPFISFSFSFKFRAPVTELGPWAAYPLTPL